MIQAACVECCAASTALFRVFIRDARILFQRTSGRLAGQQIADLVMEWLCEEDKWDGTVDYWPTPRWTMAAACTHNTDRKSAPLCLLWECAQRVEHPKWVERGRPDGDY